MIAKMKCSNCGSELSNLNMTWDRKQLWFIIPVMLLGFLPMMKLFFFKGKPTEELTISNVQKRSVNANLEVIGLITNKGGHDWQSVEIEAEFFDASGNFLDEASQYLRSDIEKGTVEHFKITLPAASPAVLSPGVRMEVKVAGGSSRPF